MRSKKILIVDDEEDILEFLSYNLSKEEYVIETSTNGPDAILKAHDFAPDLIILDVMMPGMDGIEVCNTLRENADLKNTLIVFLTARSESFTEISAFDSGGDDFINKPIKPNVLKSRIKAILRRHFNNQIGIQSEKLEFGELVIDFDRMQVIKKEKVIKLAKKEFELLALLASKPEKVFKRKNIMKKVWGSEIIVGDRTIDVHIRKLREKIGKEYIDTYKGVGYKFIG
ncbi:MAG: response regulator transcription factor [Saprospiraceae bacterium]|nr:response regulator transcription factor [Saprospiraceae bacterium]|tara:strand:+ start:575 stop:1258 length:684 start_codon:yes stop_codon:yes gene_type:complete